MNHHDLPRRLAVAVACLVAVVVGACTTTPTDSTASTTVTSGVTGSTPDPSDSNGGSDATDTTDTHAEADDGDYDPADATEIALADGASSVDGPGASAEGDVVTIDSAGTYLLSGSLSDGQVVVNSIGDGQVKLVLDGVDLASASNSPVVVTEADEVVVILADGSVNRLADSAASGADDEVEDAPTATLFSMADLTLAGSGRLEVAGASNDGIGSKDGLVILGGTITVDAVDDGIRGKDYLVVTGGTIDVTAGGDGLKADNDNTGELGWIRLSAGTVTVAAGSQGLDAVGAIDIVDGSLTVSESEEGLQAMALTITGGSVTVTASDDGLNATAHTVEGGAEHVEEGVHVTITGGTVTIAAGVDGIDSNGVATITGGTVAISIPRPGGGNGYFDVNGALTTPGVVTLAVDGIESGRGVAITDGEGQVVASFVANNTFPSTVVTAAGIVAGETYTVHTGDGTSAGNVGDLVELGTVTATDVSRATTTMGGRPGGGGPGGGLGR